VLIAIGARAADNECARACEQCVAEKCGIHKASSCERAGGGLGEPPPAERCGKRGAGTLREGAASEHAFIALRVISSSRRTSPGTSSASSSRPTVALSSRTRRPWRFAHPVIRSARAARRSVAQHALTVLLIAEVVKGREALRELVGLIGVNEPECQFDFEQRATRCDCWFGQSASKKGYAPFRGYQ
jgi:hypothetical protein